MPDRAGEPDTTHIPRMRNAGSAVIAGALLAIALPLAAQQPVVITRVAVVDARSAEPARERTIVIRGTRIVSVGPANAVEMPAGARIVDGRGLYVIPGLWDMHVHADVPAGRELLGLYLANGVTGVRDMAGQWDTLRRWRGEISTGRLSGPRIVASGPYLEGGDSPVPHLLARNPDEARAAVDSLIALRVDLVKVHGRLSPPVFFAIARRAREQGIPFGGHVSATIGARAASDSGLRSVEHLLGIPLPCTAAESIALRPRFPVQTALGRCSTRDLASLYHALAGNGTWVTPTFTAAYEIASWPRRDLPGDRYARHLPDTLKAFVRQLFPMPDSIPRDANRVGRAVLAKRQQQIVAMRRAGVGVLAGTDAPLRNSPPGFGLHEELWMLVQGGLTPLEALRAATLEPARYLAATDSMGTVEAGKVADLVLLEANPLADIRNTRRIRLVIAAGRVYERKALKELLERGTRKQ